MSAPVVSIVIPAYNAARTLGSTIESALGQTVRPHEVIVVDDGSADATRQVASGYATSGVTLVRQANCGAAAARNAGIRAAHGRFVALLDADDLWVPEKLEKQLAHLSRHPSSSAVQCGAFFVNDALEVQSVHPCIDTGRALVESLLFQNLPAFLSALVVDRQALERVGMFDTSLEILEEWDMALKMSRFCAMRSVCEPLVKYRVHAGNRHRNVDIHIAPGLQVLDRLYADRGLPPEVVRLRRRAYGTFYRTLAGGYFVQGAYGDVVRWTLRALAADPSQVLYMAAMPARRLRRRLSVVGFGSRLAATHRQRREDDPGSQ